MESVRWALRIDTGKGIAYQLGPSSASWVAIVKSLDSGVVPKAEGEYVCRIEGRWYIYSDCFGWSTKCGSRFRDDWVSPLGFWAGMPAKWNPAMV